MIRNAVLAAVLAVGFLSSASAATQKYHATLNGASENPATTSTGTGTLAASLDTATKTLTYTVTFDGLTGPATMAVMPRLPRSSMDVSSSWVKVLSSPEPWTSTNWPPSVMTRFMSTVASLSSR